jgi:L-ascorbate metabolism protein UlaG (beta-lactamase superfamily)
MKITKYVHSCLMVESGDRVAIFDPGVMSYPAFDFNSLSRLDDIFITHVHQDHVHVPFVKELIAKFPGVRITTTKETAEMLEEEGISAQTDAPEGVSFFDAPHENVQPLFPQPEEVGIHYLNVLTQPGDSHSFNETKEILAFPITGPWGSSITGLNLILKLQPKHVIPIHDWHWSEDAKQQMYGGFEKILSDAGITLHKPETGKPIEIIV